MWSSNPSAEKLQRFANTSSVRVEPETRGGTNLYQSVFQALRYFRVRHTKFLPTPPAGKSLWCWRTARMTDFPRSNCPTFLMPAAATRMSRSEPSVSASPPGIRSTRFSARWLPTGKAARLRVMRHPLKKSLPIFLNTAELVHDPHQKSSFSRNHERLRGGIAWSGPTHRRR